jgi:hypothetical protein
MIIEFHAQYNLCNINSVVNCYCGYLELLKPWVLVLVCTRIYIKSRYLMTRREYQFMGRCNNRKQSVSLRTTPICQVRLLLYAV